MTIQCASTGCSAEFAERSWGRMTKKYCSKRCRDRMRELKGRTMRRRAGFTLEDFNRKLTSQSGMCPILGVKLLTKGMDGYHRRHPFAACADHDHATNRPRGVISRSANILLGIFNDDSSLLREAGLKTAAEYIENSRKFNANDETDFQGKV